MVLIGSDISADVMFIEGKSLLCNLDNYDYNVISMFSNQMNTIYIFLNIVWYILYILDCVYISYLVNF